MQSLMARDPDPIPEDLSHTLAAAAIGLAKSGDRSGAQAALNRALRARENDKLPIAFFTSVLRQSGAPELADWFRDAAIAGGKDALAAVPDYEERLAANSPDAAAAACAGYEALFAAGAMNPKMIGRYAICLSRAGRWDDLALLQGPEALFQCQRLERMARFASLEAFHAQLLDEMRAGAERSFYQGRRFMYGVERLHNIQRLEGVAVQALMAVVRSSMTAQAEAVAALPPSHPMQRLKPGNQDLRLWSNIYGPGAYVDMHIHRSAWLTGIYYPEAPEVDWGATPHGGMLRVGCPDALGGIPGPGWVERQVHPAPGVLVIMPAYFYHWSLPYQGAGQRIAVTIDWRR